MDWTTLLAYITGSVDQELLRRHEYLVMENRLLRHRVTGRGRLSDGEHKALAEIGKKLGKKALERVGAAAVCHSVVCAKVSGGSAPAAEHGRSASSTSRIYEHVDLV